MHEVMAAHHCSSDAIHPCPSMHDRLTLRPPRQAACFMTGCRLANRVLPRYRHALQ